MDKIFVQKWNENVSKLGMGCMRLPVKDGAINYSEAEALIDTLMAGGVTYYDTAYFYHGGKSESFCKKALTDRYERDKFTLTTKLPLHLCKDNASARELTDTQFKRLGVTMLDFHLLHGINLEGWEKAKRIGADKLQDEMKADGRIRFKGFSFHGANDDFHRILDDNDWDLCQIQLNYADWSHTDAERLYREAAERGVPIIVMEPVRGGGLADPPPIVEDVLSGIGQSPAEIALRWVGSLPAVTVVLSGMSNLEQASQNLDIFSDFKTLSNDELAITERAARAFDELPLVRCTHCNYCDSCPQGIPIPRLFSGHNDYIRYKNTWTLVQEYIKGTKDENKVTACIECGACEAACPQGIGIISELKRVHELAASLR